MGMLDSIFLILFVKVHDHIEAYWRVESETPSLEEETTERGPGISIFLFFHIELSNSNKEKKNSYFIPKMTIAFKGKLDKITSMYFFLFHFRDWL